MPARSVAINGTYAAFSSGDSDGAGVGAFIDLIDVRTGRLRGITGRYPDAPGEGKYYYIRLALRPSGTLA